MDRKIFTSIERMYSVSNSEAAKSFVALARFVAASFAEKDSNYVIIIVRSGYKSPTPEWEPPRPTSHAVLARSLWAGCQTSRSS